MPRTRASYEIVGHLSVPGWFATEDVALFGWLLGRGHGDLLEIGAYKGRSAIQMGYYIRPGESFTVCDLFGASAGDANATEVAREYADLNRQAFETNYLGWHPQLPTILEVPSSEIRLPEASCRFVHVDGSHLYEHVTADVATARSVLNEDGIVVFDDWQAHHTPGVHFAVLEAVISGQLQPIVGSPNKLYATWNSELAAELRAEVPTWAAGQPRLGLDVQRIRDFDLARVWLIEEPETFRERWGRRAGRVIAGR